MQRSATAIAPDVVERARNDERRQLRRDLHDGVGPSLVGLTLVLERARDLLAVDPALVESLLAQAASAARETMGDLRRIVDGERPRTLDDLGLGAALEEQTRRLGVGRPRLSLDVSGELRGLAAPVESAAYWIVSEALGNAIRHAGAAYVRVTLAVRADELSISVIDDGRGFGSDVRLGVGLRSMRQRAREVGGRLSIESTPNRGTRISVTLPLSDAQPVAGVNRSGERCRAAAAG